MTYREHRAPPGLGPWLACTWERRAVSGSPVRVLPDGCVDVVWIAAAGTQIVGANTSAFLVALAPGTRVVGARLRPGAAATLLGVAPEALLDARVPVEEAWGNPGKRLAEALEADGDPLERLCAALLARAERAERPDSLVGGAVARLGRPGAAVGSVARELCVSERQLRRRVTAGVGYGPKRLARVLRLGRALESARRGEDLGRVAIEAGYADQAHFANDCRALAGVSPSTVLAG
jgi:AraC-like DNA-binding protein